MEFSTQISPSKFTVVAFYENFSQSAPYRIIKRYYSQPAMKEHRGRPSFITQRERERISSKKEQKLFNIFLLLCSQLTHLHSELLQIPLFSDSDKSFVQSQECRFRHFDTAAFTRLSRTACHVNINRQQGTKKTKKQYHLISSLRQQNRQIKTTRLSAVTKRLCLLIM